MTAADAYHRMLLGLSGRVPDGLIRAARTWLAAGEFAQVRRAVLGAALAAGTPVTAQDAALLREEDPAAGALPIAETEPPAAWVFAPAGPDLLAEFGDTVPSCLDLTEGFAGTPARDPVDERAVAAAAGSIALWRVWRYPEFRASWPAPARVFLVHSQSDSAALAARLQAELPEDIGVEVFTGAGDLADYQRAALDRAALLWTATPRRPIRVLPVHPGQPGFTAGHPRCSEVDRAVFTAYLDRGAEVLRIDEKAEDLVDPARGRTVPMGLRTDGSLVWSEAAGYYLREYGLTPDPALQAAARTGLPGTVDLADVHRCLAAIYAAALSEQDEDEP
ncbi:MAG TPA: hypothetical protein VN408_03375 [Actinoplanes sp.]|nr:hypothetical protein [Actinoplanes sp.]